MKYDAVLFDYDGTVADSLPDIAGAVNRALALFGLPTHTAERIRPMLGSGARVLMERAAPPGTPPETLAALYDEYVRYYAAHASDNTAPYPGVVPMLRALRERGIRTAVVSNKPDAIVQPGAEKLFAGLLDHTVGERPSLRRKPGPDMAEAAAAALGVALSRCLYVGDTEVDIETAKNAGLDCLAVTWGFRDREALRAAGAEHIIDEPAQLLAFVCA